MGCGAGYVLDSSVCIDLSWTGVSAVFVRLPFEFVLPDLVRAELILPNEIVEATREANLEKGGVANG